MRRFRKESDPPPGGFVDIHAHILPLMDDGAVSIEESVEMAALAASRGVSRMVATPHLNEAFSWDRDLLESEVSALNDALHKANVKLEVYTGAEIRATSAVFESLDAGELPTLAGSSYLLLEMPFEEIPFFMGELVFRMKTNGLTPVLAHPERTLAVQRKPRKLESLIAQGCLLQINASSIDGRFGAHHTAAVELIRRGWAFALASDAHDLTSRPPGLRSAIHAATRLFGGKKAMELVYRNPGLIIEDGIARKAA
ncbi:MAG: tyrosine-protein phosphatase [Candidatus Aquicultorales bacterium]